MLAEKTVGLYRAIVTNNRDPESLLRLKVQVPQLFGMTETDWLPPVVPVAVGVTVPGIGDPVWVSFEAGDINRPVWMGIWYAYRPAGSQPDIHFGGVVSETSYGQAPTNGTAQTLARSDHSHGSPPAEMPPHLLAGDPHPQYATDTDVSTTNTNLAAETSARIAAINTEMAARIAADALKVDTTKLYSIRTYARASFR